MKNLVKKISIVAMLVCFIFPVSAVWGASSSSIKDDSLGGDRLILAQENVAFSRIGLQDVPQVVKSTVMVRYAAYRIDESYIGSDNTYKLVIENGKTRLTVIYHKNGQCIKNDTNSVWKKVVLG